MYWLLIFVCCFAHQQMVISFSGDSDNECADNEFRCSTGECVPIGSLCNNAIDCADGEGSGVNCNNLGNNVEATAGGCFNDDFTCDNGQCIPSRWRCDKFDDCTDRSDEYGCSTFNTIGSDSSMNPDYFSSCEPDEFTCYDGQCIGSIYVCDNFGDCSDGSDEFSCPVTPTEYHIDYTPSTPDPCASLYCQNYGECTISWWTGEASCDCPEGFGGEYCEQDLCAELKCQNNGECKISPLLWIQNAYCDCPKGFAGKRCEQDLCANHGCLNGGECKMAWLFNIVYCQCPDGYKGKHCEKECGKSLFGFGCKTRED